MSIVKFDKSRDGGEIVESESTVEAYSPNATYTLVKATIDSQIATARAFPRSLSRSMARVKTTATLTQGIAKSCVYTLPRGGKAIEGPSVRFAEIVASEWGNLFTQSRVIDETDRYITVIGECIDLERNNRVSIEVRARTTDKYGKPYNDDMKTNAINAASSKARRNAIFQVVPRALWEDAYQEVRQVIAGQYQSIDQVRAQWLDTWGKKGIKPDAVYAALEVNGPEEITLDHCVTMEGWVNALKDGEVQLSDIFVAQPTVSVKAKALTDALHGIKDKPSKSTPQEKPAAKDAAGADSEWLPGVDS